MKLKREFWIALAFCAALHPLTRAQALPDNPAPAQAHDPMWARVQNLKPGTPIVVSDTYGPPVRCLFSGATEASLDCNPFGNPRDTGFRFNRIDVISVELDRPGQNGLQSKPDRRNYHPAWISSMVIGGTLMGAGFAQQMSAGRAAEGGAISALVIGMIGAPFAFSPFNQNFTPARPQFAFGIPLRLRFAHR